MGPILEKWLRKILGALKTLSNGSDRSGGVQQ
jgi:hypothetical protein